MSLYKSLPLLCLMCFCQLAGAQADKKWKLSGIDIYYSGYIMNNSRINYPVLDRHYAVQGTPDERFTFNTQLLQHNSKFALNGFHANVVFTNFLNRKRLHSQEIRLGASYFFSNSSAATALGLSEFYGEDRDPQLGDTFTRYYLGYGHEERAVNIDFSYLLNIKLSRVCAVYGGATASVTPYQRTDIYYSYHRYQRVPGSLPRNTYWESGSHRPGNIGAISGGALAGIKFNANCTWNIFTEFTYLYRVAMLNKPQQTPGFGVHLGIRYKLGEVQQTDENPKGLFW